MKRVVIGRSAWLISGTFGLMVGALIVLMFKSPVIPTADTVAPSGSLVAPVEIKVVGAAAKDVFFREETTLRDPTPLFLPTRWNAAENAVPSELMRDHESAFRGYPPSLAFPAASLDIDLPPAVQVPGRPADAFAAENPDRPFIGFGQVDRGIPQVATRGAFLKVVAAETGVLVVSEPLPQAAPPGEALWQPLEFLLAVDPSGIVQPPVLTESSRVASVDGYFEGYLLRSLHLGERLHPGFYRVSIGP